MGFEPQKPVQVKALVYSGLPRNTSVTHLVHRAEIDGRALFKGVAIEVLKTEYDDVFDLITAWVMPKDAWHSLWVENNAGSASKVKTA